MSRGTLVSAALLAALAGSAYAAEPADDAVNFPAKQRAVPAGVSSRPVERPSTALAISAPNEGAGSRGNAGSAVAVQVAKFPPFPPAQGIPDPILIDGIDVGWVAFGPPIPGDFDLVVTFYQDTIGVGDLSSPNTPFYSNAVGSFSLLGQTPNYNFVEWFGEFLDITTPIPLAKTKTFAYEVRIFQAGTNLMWPGNAASSSVVVPLIRGPIQPQIGTFDIRRWNDDNSVVPTRAYSLNGTLPVDFNNFFPTLIAITNRRDVYTKLRSDFPPPPPPAGTIDLGTVDCQSSSISVAAPVNPTAVQWYKFQLSNDVSVDAGTYLDIRLSQDFGLGLDTPSSMGLYNQFGERIRFNTIDGGGGIYGMLTFGAGRRSKDAGGNDFDGRDGSLTKDDPMTADNEGLYFLAVAGSAATYGGSLFATNTDATIDVGSVLLEISSNAGTPNCGLPSIVAPTVRAADALGTLTPGLVSTGVLQTGRRFVRWVTFTLPTELEVSGANPANFLDINQNGTPVADPALGLYTDAGDLVAFDRNSGQTTSAATQRLGQLSFGGAASGVRNPDGNGAPYNNYSGSSVPAGDYYLAVTLDGDTESTTGQQARFDPAGWTVRSDSESFITVSVNIKTPTGCRIDFNNDGSINPDDIGDFITAYFTNPPVPGPGGYAVPCPGNPAPYDQGYQAAYNADGSGQCGEPNPDNLGDYITDYFIGCAEA